MIQVSHLTKKYGQNTAVDDISFEIRQGEIVGYLGPNGAGKSTTLKMLVGLLQPTSGEISVAGYSAETELLKLKRHIGYVPEEAQLYEHLSLVEHLQLIGRLYHLEERPHRRKNKRSRKTVRHGSTGKPKDKRLFTGHAAEVYHYVSPNAQPRCPVFRRTVHQPGCWNGNLHENAITTTCRFGQNDPLLHTHPRSRRNALSENNDYQYWQTHRRCTSGGTTAADKSARPQRNFHATYRNNWN